MSDLPLMAATEWARSNSTTERDPVAFGHKVAQVYLAAQATQHHSGNEQATAAALAALSIPAEVWQSLAQLSGHLRVETAAQNQINQVDAK